MFPYLEYALEKVAEEQAMTDEPVILEPDELVAELEDAIDNGVITEEEALDILAQVEEALREHYDNAEKTASEFDPVIVLSDYGVGSINRDYLY